MKTIEIVFRTSDALQKRENFSVFLSPVDNEIGAKWAEALTQCLQEQRLLEKSYSFIGFTSFSRDRAAITAELRKNIEIINSFSWKTPYHINGTYHHLLTQEDLNYLHHQFEMLIGQVWAPSPLFAEATTEVRQAIRKINNLVHEYEQLQAAVEDEELGREPHSQINFPFICCERHALKGNDRSFFQTHIDAGDAVLHYCQLGKTHYEAYHDEDENIQKSNINGLRYFTGEFDLHLRDIQMDLRPPENATHFEDWLKQNEFNSSFNELGVGFVKVAQIVGTSATDITTPSQIKQKLSQGFEIIKIHVVDSSSGAETSDSYDYSSEESDRKIVSYFKKLRFYSESPAQKANWKSAVKKALKPLLGNHP